jgi:carbon storage regulator
MLVVSRKKNERIVIGGNIVVTVCEIGPGKVRIGIDAPKDVSIYRQEIIEQYQRLPKQEKKGGDKDQP